MLAVVPVVICVAGVQPQPVLLATASGDAGGARHGPPFPLGIGAAGEEGADAGGDGAGEDGGEGAGEDAGATAREPEGSSGAELPALAGPPAGAREGAAPSAGLAGAAAGAPRLATGALAGYAERLSARETRRVTAAHAWGLSAVPLRPPEPPTEKPELRPEPGHLSGPGLPPVVTRVPTEDRVVFLTIDDGAEKDPELLRMLEELEVPVSAFLTDYVARDDYGYFRAAQEGGAGIHNHTLSHPELPRLSLAEQRAEICGQQANLAREFGAAPRLFRPPYGAYNGDTLRAAADCGATAVPLWSQEAFPDRIEWARPDARFHPGDIILTHFRGDGEWDGDMPTMVRRVLETATEQGFAVARLEDYL